MKAVLSSIVIAFSTIPFSVPVMADTAVARIADGTWADPTVIYGNGFAYSMRNIWVDIRVQNLGYNKTVGIRWTDNNWYTWHDSLASYEHPLAGGYEQWGVDVTPVGKYDWRRYGIYWVELTGYEQLIGTQGKTVQYAIFYKDHNNIWHWAGQNYSIQVVAPG